jgi:hypothetical protein
MTPVTITLGVRKRFTMHGTAPINQNRNGKVIQTIFAALPIVVGYSDVTMRMMMKIVLI